MEVTITIKPETKEMLIDRQYKQFKETGKKPSYDKLINELLRGDER